MNMNAEELRRITLKEFGAMKKDERQNYELIDGIVLMSPRPSLEHQEISGNLYFELRQLLGDHGCRPIQEVDLVLKDASLIPDLMVICNDHLAGKRYEKPPLIVIEIVSPSSASRDYITKRYKYEQLGIKEYWIVSPEERCVTAFDFTSGSHEICCHGQFHSAVLPDIVIDLDAIFT